MKAKDWIALIEAGYSLGCSDDWWLQNVLDHATPLFDRGFWPTIGTYSYTPMQIHLTSTKTSGTSTAIKFLESSIQVKTKAVGQFFRDSSPVCSLSEAIYSREPGVRDIVRHITDGQVEDKLAIKALTGQNSALILCWLFSDTVTPTTQERNRWTLMASHLAAGLRLRSVAESLTLEETPVEAIFDPGGKLHDARHAAQNSTTREILRDAVRRIDRVRTHSGRSDPDAAMKHWEGLVLGRWSLVDWFDSDGRRFMVAVKNDPIYPDPRGLTMRERQIAEFVGLGRMNKEISYTLGISQSAVSNCTVSVQLKLGLASRTELAAFFAPSGIRARLAEISIAGEVLLVGDYPLINKRCVDGLTEAEQHVLAYLLAGSTNSDIAKRRKTSVRTIANQIQSIFHKLGVSFRSELAVKLQSVN